jgi:hypothetical protein
MLDGVSYQHTFSKRFHKSTTAGFLWAPVIASCETHSKTSTIVPFYSSS